MRTKEKISKESNSIHSFSFKLKFISTDIIAYIATLCFAVAGSIVSVGRFWQYEIFYYDFGIFDQAIYKVSRFQAPIIEHLVVGGRWIFADHFNPSIFVYSPLYWIWDRSELLLIAQAITVALSGLVIYLIGKEVIRNNFFALTISLCYFLFVGVQNAVISDFHEVTVMTLFFALTYFSLVKNKVKAYYLFLLLTLGFKESAFLLGIGIGVALLMLRKWKKHALITILISVIWGLLAIKVIIPYFSGGTYQYSSDISFNPQKVIISFFDHPTKLQTLFYSFLNFGFLPLFAPSFYFLTFVDFVVRFLPTYSYLRWGLGLHYSIQTAVILALSTIYAYNFLLKFPKLKKWLYAYSLVILTINLYVYHVVLHGALALSYNRTFYTNTRNYKFLDVLVKKVEKDRTIMTQNNLAAHFTHNPSLWLLKSDYEQYMPDYIVIDIREGQGANNFFGTTHPKDILEKIKKDIKYTTIYSTREQYVFKKKDN